MPKRFSLSRLWIRLGAAMGIGMAPALAHANGPFPIWGVKCNGLPGCGGGPFNILETFTFPALITLLLQIITALALVYIIYAAYQMLFALGDEGKITKARWAILYALGGLALAILSGTLITFVVTQPVTPDPNNPVFGNGGVFATIVQAAVFMFNVAFAIIIVISGIRMVAAHGKSDEFHKAIQTLIWSIVAAVLLNLARAIIVAFLQLGISTLT